MNPQAQRPTSAFVGASWLGLIVGTATFLLGLWSAKMMRNRNGYYLTVLMSGLFSNVSLQKSVRDRLEGIAVTGLYFGLAWISLGLSIMLPVVGLWNAELTSSEKCFYAMAFVLSLFAAVAVQRNVRDVAGIGGRPARPVAPRSSERTE